MGRGITKSCQFVCKCGRQFQLMFRDVAEARCSSSQVFRYLVIFVARKKFCKVHFAVPRSFGIVFVFWGRNEHSEVAMRFAFGGGSGLCGEERAFSQLWIEV